MTTKVPSDFFKKMSWDNLVSTLDAIYIGQIISKRLRILPKNEFFRSFFWKNPRIPKIPFKII